MTARWRVPIYAAFLALLAGFAVLQRPSPTKTEQGPRRETLRELPAVERMEAATSRSEPVAAPTSHPSSSTPSPAQAACVTAPDVPQEFIDAAALSDAQATQVNAWTAEWRADLKRLGSDAIEGGWSPPVVGDRAKAIQDVFEDRLRTLLTSSQMNVYESYRQRGLVGTYVIEIPRPSP